MMKTKHVAIVMAIAAMIIGSGLFVTKPAYSTGAVVINPAGECVFFDGNGGSVFTTDTRIVATPSANQNTLFTCSATNIANSQGHAVNYDTNNNPTGTGIQCGIASPNGFVFTSDWHETVSANGNAVVQCHFKN